MRVLICGSRRWTNSDAIRREISTLKEGSVIIQDAAAGADTLSSRIAGEFGLKVQEYRADWRWYGRAAGPIRNALMLREGRPDVVWAFHEHIEQSKGTLNMITQARKAGVDVKVFER